MKSTRLKGHALMFGGHPYIYSDYDGGYHLAGLGCSTGVATCSCGVRSQKLSSTAERRRWHRDHKEQMRAQMRDALMGKAKKVLTEKQVKL